jgi:hypothetical protein
MMPRTLRRSRQGFALAAALGVLAGLFVLVVAANSAVQGTMRQGKRRETLRNDLAVSEAAVGRALALRASSAGTAQPYECEIDGTPCSVRLEALAPSDGLYQSGGLAPRSGDLRVETTVGPPIRATRIVWLINAAPDSRRMILLERGAGSHSVGRR